MEELVGLKAGPIVDRKCYTSDPIFRTELQRIFGQTWLFLAHESELQKPGDFITSDLAGQPVLAVRGDDGAIRVFFNSCRHRGTIVETERRGNRKRFRCQYHHWEYNARGQLTLVPREAGYGSNFGRDELGLVPIARVEVFHGLVFASLSPTVPSLVDYIGEAAPLLTEIAAYNGRPQEEVGSFEFTYDGNWKLYLENSSDDYHNEYLHSRVYNNVPGFQYGRDYTSVKNARTERKRGSAAPADSAGLGPQSHQILTLGPHTAMHWHEPADKLAQGYDRTHRLFVVIFPSFVGVFNPVVNMSTLRIIKPEGVERTRVLNYCLAPADLPKADKKAVASRFSVAAGPAGLVMMDDIRILNLVQKGLKATMAGESMHTRGLERPGPVGLDADDHALRNFWDSWRKYMLNHVRTGACA